jgi:hypothetical protein
VCSGEKKEEKERNNKKERRKENRKQEKLNSLQETWYLPQFFIYSSVPRNITEIYSSIPKPRKVAVTDEHRVVYSLVN